MNTRKFIRTPFPGEALGEGAWHECTTWYELNVLWPKHAKKAEKGHKDALPTFEGTEPPQ